MEINFKEYLSDNEIKEIIESELREQIRMHFKDEDNSKRLISNLSYQIIYDEVDKLLPNFQDELVSSVVNKIKNNTAFHLFDYYYPSGEPRSLGAKIITETVRENKQLIKDKVVEQLQNRDYTEDAWNKFENLAEEFTSNIYEFVELIRKNK